MKLKTIDDVDLKKIPPLEFKYQKDLTLKLDDFEQDFDQNIINEIMLWKVNRYGLVDGETLSLINQIKREATDLDKELTRKILRRLLVRKGFGLPMASTVLRFKNPKIYQLIDQRVYRLIGMGRVVPTTNKKNVNDQIETYFAYLNKLREVCHEYNLKFETADRFLYMIDKLKEVNGKIPLSNYGSKANSNL